MVIHKFSPLLSYLSTPFLCAAGIGRTFWHRKVVPAQTACRETYGLLLYAGVAQSVELYRANGYAIECPWSLVRVHPSAQEAGSHPDNVRPFVVAHMEMTMLAENCTVGGNRLSVMVLHM